MNLNHVIYLALIVVLSSCQNSNDSSISTSPVATVNPVKEVIMDSLKRPWSMAFLNDNEALLAEKDGDILKVNLATKERQVIEGFPSDLADSLLIVAKNYPFLTYPSDANGIKLKYNAGLFDIVLDPDFENNNWVYISYVSQKEDKFATKVIRAQIENNTFTNVETLLMGSPYGDGLFHFGGGLVFGSDKNLYITVGERLFGDNLQPPIPIAQNEKDQRGKVYRINRDGSIPIDNPDFGSEAVPGLYAVGIRAAQGLTKDPRNGDLWFSEHGTFQGDELNLLTKGSNYGWPVKSTGRYRGGYEPPELERTFTDPKWSWHKTIAPTGLTFYTGKEFPQWKNNLIVPGLSRGNFWRLVIENQEIISVEELFITDRHRTRKAVQSPAGELYILTDEQNGKIIKIKNGDSL